MVKNGILFSKGISIPSLAPTFMQMDFSDLLSFNYLTIMISFMFVDLFDTLGTLIGVASKANMLDAYGRLPRIRGALLADSIATAGGAILGTSTVTTFVESSAGVAVGGRTGLTGIVSAGLFLISLLLAPIFLAIPAFATAPALIVVGFMMLSSIMNIDFTDFTEAIPAFIAIIMMPFTYSIANGIMFGMLSWVILKLLMGKAKEISGVMWISVALFALYIVLKVMGLA